MDTPEVTSQQSNEGAESTASLPVQSGQPALAGDQSSIEESQPQAETSTASQALTSPSVGAQAQAILESDEGIKLNDEDKKYLAQVAELLKDQPGVLHRNPDGSPTVYAPINVGAGPATESKSAQGVVRSKPGYAFKSGVTEYKREGSGEKVVLTPDTLTHGAMLRLMNQDPSWFRRNVVRGFYKVDDPYWEGK